jgi:hypothetical protein
MRIKSFTTQDKAKPDIENIKDLNLEAVRFTTAQTTELPSQHKLSKIWHDLSKPGLTEACAVHIQRLYYFVLGL